MVVPVFLAPQGSGAAAPTMALAATLGASMGFMFPVSTPPNAMVYGSGRIRITEMIRAGFLLDVTGVLVVWLASQLLVPLLLVLV